MKGIVRSLSLLVLLTIPASVSGQTFVELDSDGQLGNGPDVMGGVPSDAVRVDVYLHHTTFFCSVNVVLCAPCAVVDSVKYWTIWTNSPPVIADSCLTLVSTGFAFCEPLISPPTQYASVWYVIQKCMCQVTVEEDQSSWFDNQFNSGSFAGSVPIGLCDGIAATEG